MTPLLYMSAAQKGWLRRAKPNSFKYQMAEIQRQTTKAQGAAFVSLAPVGYKKDYHA